MTTPDGTWAKATEASNASRLHEATSADALEHSVKLAWRVHDQHLNWIERVDNKALIVLALETASVTVIVNSSIDGRPLGDLSGWSVWAYRAGVVALALAAVAATGVVFPQLAKRTAKSGADQATAPGPGDRGLIYFGHLQNNDGVVLRERFVGASLSDELNSLVYQLSALSRINVIKHRLVQVSMLSWAAGGLLVALAYALN